MEEFLYYAPTKVVFGKGCESRVGELIKEEGTGSALVDLRRQQQQKSPDCLTESLPVSKLRA